MAITHTKTVTELVIINDNDKIVSEVQITTTSVDDSNPSVLTRSGVDMVTLETTGITTSTVGFTTFANLTESAILDWDPVKNDPNIATTIIHQTAWIESVKNPPAPAEVSEALPW